MPASENRRFKFLPLTIRLETLGGVATPLVLRGTPLPATRSDVFSTGADNQSSVEVKLFLGEAPLTENNLTLGTFKLDGIPPAKAGVPQIKVEFAVDQSCGIVASATLQGSNITKEQRFDPPSDLSDDAIEELITAAKKTQQEDEERLRKVEAINRANNLVRSAEERLKSGTNAQLSAAIAELGLGLASDNVAVIREKSDALDGLLTSSIDPFSSDIFNAFFSHVPQKKTVSGTSAAKTSKKTPATRARQDVTVSTHPQLLGKIFGGAQFTLDPQLCFVLMPFDDKFQPLYDDQIKPAVDGAGLRCQRADDIRGTGLITWDIWEGINRARFLIAELTDRNPNVFYEVGLAHALSKDVILITQSMEFVPFDLKTVRCICYDYTPRGVEKLTTALERTIEALIKAG